MAACRRRKGSGWACSAEAFEKRCGRSGWTEPRRTVWAVVSLSGGAMIQGQLQNHPLCRSITTREKKMPMTFRKGKRQPLMAHHLGRGGGRPLGSGPQLPPQLTVRRRPLWGGGAWRGGSGRGDWGGV